MECCTTSCVLIAVGFFFLYKLLDYLIRIPKVGSLRSKRILVTGCDTGFGHEIAKRLDSMGVQVFAGCLTEQGETELRKSCSSRLKTVKLNVADPKSVRQAYERVREFIPAGQGLWAVMNNAGIAGNIGPVEWLTLENYRKVMDVNILGLIDVTVTFLPLIKVAKGRIVNTASVFGRCSLVGSTPYCISKYGVEAFSDATRRQLADFGVTTHLIEPGFHKTNIVNTDNLDRSMRQSWNQASPEIQKEYGEKYLNDSIEHIVKNFVSSVVSDKISDVVDAYEHALIGWFPRARYVVGKDAKLVWLPLNKLPEWLGDRLLKMLANKPPVPAALMKK